MRNNYCVTLLLCYCMSIFDGVSAVQAAPITQRESAEKIEIEPISPLSEEQEQLLEKELKGNYPALARKSSLPLGTLQKAWEHPHKSSGQLAPGIVRYAWSPSFVMPIRLRDFMTTTLHFPRWERITSFYLGDPLIFQVQQAEPNILILRAQNAGADTNFTAIGTGGNVYSFYLRSEGWNSNHLSDFTVYIDAPSLPNTTPSVAIQQEELYPMQPSSSQQHLPDYLRAIVFKPENMQFDMNIYARSEEDAAIAPERVWHDGIFTYFDYGYRADNVQRPVIYLVIDGTDTMVNTRSAGPNNHILIAEAVGNFTLRNGQKSVCVKREPLVNETGGAVIASTPFHKKNPLLKTATPSSKETVKHSQLLSGISSAHHDTTLPAYPPYYTRLVQ